MVFSFLPIQNSSIRTLLSCYQKQSILLLPLSELCKDATGSDSYHLEMIRGKGAFLRFSLIPLLSTVYQVLLLGLWIS